MYVSAYTCVSTWETEGSNTTQQSGEQLEGEKAELFTRVCFPPERPYLQEWFKADLFLSVEEIWGD